MVEGRTKEGFATVTNVLYSEPKVFRQLLHKIAHATILYLKAQIAAGVSAVQLFDTWCGELDVKDYTEFVLPAVQEIISGLGNKVPIIYYTKASRSEEHTSELQSPDHLVCRLLLEKKKNDPETTALCQYARSCLTACQQQVHN